MNFKIGWSLCNHERIPLMVYNQSLEIQKTKVWQPCWYHKQKKLDIILFKFHHGHGHDITCKPSIWNIEMHVVLKIAQLVWISKLVRLYYLPAGRYNNREIFPEGNMSLYWPTKTENYLFIFSLKAHNAPLPSE